MATPELLQFDRLLAPIPGANPAGRALREDYSPRSAYQTIKSARSAARDAERKLATQRLSRSSAQELDDRRPDGELNEKIAVDWKPLCRQAEKILIELSKDLEIVVWWIEALVREQGFAGLRDGFRLARELSQRYWDGLYPLPDEEGILTRVAPLTAMNGEDSEGVLITPIFNVPLTTAGGERAMSLADYRQAVELEKIQDAQRRAARVEQGAVSLDMFEKALRETPTEWLQNLREDLEGCLQEFAALCTVMEEKCGLDAPPSSSIRNALQAVQEELQRRLRERSGSVEEPAADSAGDPAPGAAPVEASAQRSGPVRSREEAFRMLQQVAEFFRRTEPHSPIAYNLEQAVRWGKMPLPDLLSELIPDETARTQLFKLVGIRTPEQ